MNKEEETEVQKAWKEHCNKRFDDISKGINGAIKGQFQLTAISDFKASLREEIEKEKVVRGVHGHYADGRTWAFEKCLQLLDTVKPSTSQPEGNTVNK